MTALVVDGGNLVEVVLVPENQARGIANRRNYVEGSLARG